MTEETAIKTIATATTEVRPSLPPCTGTLRLPNRARPAPATMKASAATPADVASIATPTAVSPDPGKAAVCKPVQAQREHGEQQAAVLRRRQELDETLATLRGHWPALFTAPVPLAIGIERRIQQALGEARLPKVRLRRALHCWTRRTGYLAAIAEGRRRQALDGADAGEPEEVHRVYARELIAERQAKGLSYRQQHRPQLVPSESIECAA